MLDIKYLFKIIYMKSIGNIDITEAVIILFHSVKYVDLKLSSPLGNVYLLADEIYSKGFMNSFQNPININIACAPNVRLCTCKKRICR